MSKEYKMTKEEVLEWIRQQEIAVQNAFSQMYDKPFEDFILWEEEHARKKTALSNHINWGFSIFNDLTKEIQDTWLKVYPTIENGSCLNILAAAGESTSFPESIFLERTGIKVHFDFSHETEDWTIRLDGDNTSCDYMIILLKEDEELFIGSIFWNKDLTIPNEVVVRADRFIICIDSQDCR